MSPSLLTYQEAAAALTVSRATVRRLVLAGKLRAVAISPRCHRVDAASVRNYLRTSVIPAQIITCPSGKTATHGVSASNAMAMSLREAVALAKKRSSSRRAP